MSGNFLRSFPSHRDDTVNITGCAMCTERGKEGSKMQWELLNSAREEHRDDDTELGLDGSSSRKMGVEAQAKASRHKRRCVGEKAVR